MKQNYDFSQWSDYDIFLFTLCPISKARTAKGAKDRQWGREMENEANRRKVRKQFGIYANNPTR
jgi:hypothetical protein